MKRLSVLLLLALLGGCGVVVDSSRANRVVFIGDSITYLWRTGDPQAFGHKNWIDKGVIGENSIQISYRFKKDVIDQFPQVVHILAGTNDVYPGWTLCSNPPGHATLTKPATSASWPYPVDTCTNIEYMVATAKRHNIRVVLGTIPPWGAGALSASADGSPERFARITQLNQWIRNYAASQGVEVVDYHAILQDQNDNNYVPAYSSDGVHPSPAGYAVMTPAAMAAVSQH